MSDDYDPENDTEEHDFSNPPIDEIVECFNIPTARVVFETIENGVMTVMYKPMGNGSYCPNGASRSFSWNTLGRDFGTEDFGALNDIPEMASLDNDYKSIMVDSTQDHGVYEIQFCYAGYSKIYVAEEVHFIDLYNALLQMMFTHKQMQGAMSRPTHQVVQHLRV